MKRLILSIALLIAIIATIKLATHCAASDQPTHTTPIDTISTDTIPHSQSLQFDQ